MSKLPKLDPLDRRLNVISERVSETQMKGKVDALKFIDGESAQIKVAFTELRAASDFSSSIDTQLIFGETVKVFDTQGEFSLVKADRDGYVGWLETKTLEYDVKSPTHLVSVPRTFFYPKADMKLPHKGMRSLGSALKIVGYDQVRGTDYAMLESGEAVIASHIMPIDQHFVDYVSVAESLLLTPYLWAGTSAFGIDCSGLVKLSMFMCGQHVLRDSDMQAATIGEEISAGKNLEELARGDLVFWRGHVAIVNGDNSIIHANGHTMSVAVEPMDQAIERIEYLYEKPIGFRRVLT